METGKRKKQGWLLSLKMANCQRQTDTEQRTTGYLFHRDSQSLILHFCQPISGRDKLLTFNFKLLT